jgi:hypothetical protein
VEDMIVFRANPPASHLQIEDAALCSNGVNHDYGCEPFGAFNAWHAGLQTPFDAGEDGDVRYACRSKNGWIGGKDTKSSPT